MHSPLTFPTKSTTGTRPQSQRRNEGLAHRPIVRASNSYDVRHCGTCSVSIGRVALGASSQPRWTTSHSLAAHGWPSPLGGSGAASRLSWSEAVGTRAPTAEGKRLRRRRDPQSFFGKVLCDKRHPNRVTLVNAFSKRPEPRVVHPDDLPVRVEHRRSRASMIHRFWDTPAISRTS